MLVDSSVWIDFFNKRDTPETVFLRQVQTSRPVLTGDLILIEVLQGFRDEIALHRARSILLNLGVVTIGGVEIALLAADYFRALRAVGITPRKTIDTMIATRCIVDGIELLFRDRDFEPFVDRLGLMPALSRATGVP